MLTAYYELLHLHDEYQPVTVTISAFGQHFDIYRDRAKLGMVPYSEEDKRRLMDYTWGDVHPSTPYIPVKRFLHILTPSA